MIDNIIYSKMLTIFYIYTFRLLVLKLQVRLNSLHKLLINIMRAIILTNLYLNTLKNINLFISQGYFDIRILINIAL